MSAPDANGWLPIETAPDDGSRFLAWQVMIADEYDEDVLIRRGVREEEVVVAYCLWGSVVAFPFTGGIPRNVFYTHWQPRPKPPVGA